VYIWRGRCFTIANNMPLDLTCFSCPLVQMAVSLTPECMHTYSPALQVPPGKFRWVTTTIARWDPDQEWPTDLGCSLALNTSLTTYDGELPGPVRFPKTSEERRVILEILLAALSDVCSY
jgi:hypothetical protein